MNGPLNRAPTFVAAVTILVAGPGGLWAQDGQEGLHDERPGVSRASQSTATEGALFLLLPVGAQGIAMGRAMTALPSQEGAFWNPAGLALVREDRALIFRGTNVAGDQTAVTMLLAQPGIGTLGLSYQLLDVGDQPLTDENNQVLGRVSVRSHLAVASFATRVTEAVSAGANFKVVSFRLTCSGLCTEGGISATTYAVDVGVQALPIEGVPLRLGAMIAHLGPRLQVINAEQSDPLPTRVRVSGAYEFLRHFGSPEDLSLWFTVELEDRWRDLGQPSLYVGTELSAGGSDILFVRAGYAYDEGDQQSTNGAAVGVGLRFERFDLGIARALSAPALLSESEPIHFTLGIVF